MRTRGLPFVFAIAVEFAFAFLSASSYAQTVGGTISGTVTDQSGAIILRAQISIKNVATAAVRTVSTGNAGFYTVPDLLAGTYQITAAASGFSTAVQSGVVVTVGAEQVINIQMRVGAVTQTVETTAAAPTVELASSTLQNVISSKPIVDLPLNGRDWTQLATLQAGVLTVRSQDHTDVGQSEHGNGVNLTISGGRPNQNNYRLNGITINDYANTAPGSALGENLGVDAVQEFSAITSTPEAEYGRSSGGIVNAITRSGTNTFHGTGYEFLRNSALDARNFFDPAQIPSFKRNQFGGSAGGPIQKDRTWVFGDYEGLRQGLGVTQISLVPSEAARAGQFCSILGSGCTPSTVPVDPIVANYLNAFYPLPNQPLASPGDVGQFRFLSTRVSNENYFTTRIDRRFSEKDTLAATYLFDNGLVRAPDEFNNKGVGGTSRRQNVSLEENHLFSSWQFLNSLRFGYTRTVTTSGTTLSILNPQLKNPVFSFVPGLLVGEIDEPDITSFLGEQVDNSAFWYNSFQAYDDGLLTRGKSVLKFGVAVERIQHHYLQPRFNSGDFMFATLPGLVSNDPTQISEFDAPLPGTNTNRGVRQTVVGLYLQDTTRLRPNLTVNLGLRYEFSTVPSEVHNEISVLRTIYDAQPHLGSPLFSNPTLHDFQPRIGFAWDPFGSGKTSVRSGFGIYDVLPLPYTFTNPLSRAAPFYNSGQITSFSAGAFPSGAFGQLGLGSGDLRAVYIEPHPPRAYVLQYNLSIQRELISNTTVMLAYVGARGTHLPTRNDNINEVLPTSTPFGLLWPIPGTGTTLNPNWGKISDIDWNGNSFYNALELQLVKKLSHRLQVQGSYTWSKSMDDGSVTADSGEFLNAVQSPFNFFDKKLNRGLSDFNVGQNLVINFTWQVPTINSWSGGSARWLMEGWQLGGIFSASSGTPFTPVLGCNPLGDPGCSSLPPRPDRVAGPGCDTLSNPGNPNHYIKTNCLSLPVAPASLAGQCQPFGFPAAPIAGTCANLLGNLGRNSVIGPGLMTMDLSVVKDSPVRWISENFKVQFRAEFFNIFNRANFVQPLDNSTVFDGSGNPISSAGLIDATQTPSRQIQFGLKLIW